MSIIEGVMREEYERSVRASNALKKQNASLPKGYLRKKRINNKDYWYLQYRDGKRVKSKYIKHSDYEKVKKDIDIRKENDMYLKEHKISQKQIEKALGKDFVNEWSSKRIS